MARNDRERVITFTVTEEYIQRYLAACKEAGVSGVGSVVSLVLAKDCEVRVYPGSLRCSVYWETKKKKFRELLLYDLMPVCYELRDGILLRVSEYQVLFLPVTEDVHSNQSLVWMRSKLRVLSTESVTLGPLTGVGIGRLSCLGDRLRMRKSRFLVGPMWPLAAFPVACFLGLALFFAYGIWETAPVPYEETVRFTAVFQDYTVSRSAKNVSSYIHLEGLPRYAVTVPRDTEGLNALPAGTSVQVALHPRSDEVVELIAGNRVLIDFEDAVDDASGLVLVMGVIVAVCGGFGIWFARPFFQGLRENRSARNRSFYDMELEQRREKDRRKRSGAKRKKK